MCSAVFDDNCHHCGSPAVDNSRRRCPVALESIVVSSLNTYYQSPASDQRNFRRSVLNEIVRAVGLGDGAFQ